MRDSRLAPLDARHPENRGVLAFLVERVPGAPLIARPSSHPDPLEGAGSHPDVVERVWDQLGRGLPRAARALVFGTPALVHESAGVVLALALGTSYALRLPASASAEPAAGALSSRHVYRGTGTALDLAAFGPAWRFGAWHAREPEWVAEAARELGAGAG